MLTFSLNIWYNMACLKRRVPKPTRKLCEQITVSEYTRRKKMKPSLTLKVVVCTSIAIVAATGCERRARPIVGGGSGGPSILKIATPSPTPSTTPTPTPSSTATPTPNSLTATSSSSATPLVNPVVTSALVATTAHVANNSTQKPVIAAPVQNVDPNTSAPGSIAALEQFFKDNAKTYLKFTLKVDEKTQAMTASFDDNLIAGFFSSEMSKIDSAAAAETGSPDGAPQNADDVVKGIQAKLTEMQGKVENFSATFKDAKITDSKVAKDVTKELAVCTALDQAIQDEAKAVSNLK